ncbi:hypothetical protein MBLNU459_g4468t1 [Dothideomycetes sp. NU459]
MQDPSYGVPHQLLPHVHLISGQKYPQQQQLNIDQAYQYLFEAPKVVKQIAPMSWQYLSGPNDGTVFLTWIGPRMQNQFPTDGYVWADPEQRYTHDFGGYTLEVAVHQSGYRPGLDQISSHSRKRYRFVSKNPSVAALPPDPSLWIVHYCQADPQNCIPAIQVGVQPSVRQQLTDRHMIESQGRLERQDFMLHDREKWPQLNMPGRGGGPPGGQAAYAQQMYNQNPMAHIGNPRFSGQYFQQSQQGQVGPSPAKRQRQHGPSQMPASAAALMNLDTTIEDEENNYHGDFLDLISQREISMTRYMQHHEWMEEVFSSPYATGQIIPVDLGFGLMGELAGLTEGLLDLPANDDEGKPPPKKKDTATAAPSYKKVSPEQLQQFESRVQAHMEKGQAELERMKEDHAKKLEALKKSKALLQAEKRLRSSAWDVNDTGSEFWRVEKTKSGNADHPQKEAAEVIVKEVELMLGGAVQPQKEATVVEKGGLRRPDKNRAVPTPSNVIAADGAANDMQIDNDFEQRTHASSEQYNQTTTTGSEQQVADAQPATNSQAPTAQPQAPQPSADQKTTAGLPDASMDNLDSIDDDDNNMSLMDDVNMDMDVDTSTLNFDTETPKTGAADMSTTDWSAQQPQPAQSSTASNSGVAQTSGDTAQQANQNDLFGATDDTGFGDFDTGDGLIDFDGGAGGDDLGFDMDNSAFGDAFHNTESHAGDDGSGAA